MSWKIWNTATVGGNLRNGPPAGPMISLTAALDGVCLLRAPSGVLRTGVHLSETSDAIGPLGAKSMSESPFNPVAPAFASALRDATGIPLHRPAVPARDQVRQAPAEQRE
ncbi:hypothetical protein ACWCXH_24785 [Kitasatospora sp. NPDC001660]